MIKAGNPFEDIPLEWAGRKVTLPARRVLGAIAAIEHVVTLAELADYSRRGTVARARLAQAYGALLRYCGLEVTDDDVYLDMFGTAEEVTLRITEATVALMSLMIPPSIREGGQASKPVLAPGETAAGNSEAPGKGASKPITKPQFVQKGRSARRSNSGN
jgi:hypothetical protein